jgi:hypothetical protein
MAWIFGSVAEKVGTVLGRKADPSASQREALIASIYYGREEGHWRFEMRQDTARSPS